jgi:hypothetical protein
LDRVNILIVRSLKHMKSAGAAYAASAPTGAPLFHDGSDGPGGRPCELFAKQSAGVESTVDFNPADCFAGARNELCKKSSKRLTRYQILFGFLI